MKKILCIILTAVLSLSIITPAYANMNSKGKHINQTQKSNKKENKKAKKYKAKKVKFNIKKSPVIKFGRYKLPVNPVTKGMGAKVDNRDRILTVTKDNITIVIDFKNETVTVNGVPDTSSGLFGSKKSKGMTVLIKYIAKILGIKIDIDDDEIEIEVPGLTAPKDITVISIGSNVTNNIINTNTLYITAAATIKAGQATGGRAELYIGSKLVATDYDIKENDTTVEFTTSDGTPTNGELKALVPKGGEVQVRLYNNKNEYVTGKSGQKLVADYEAPFITGFSSAEFNAVRKQLIIKVSTVGKAGDTVDVTLLSLYDASLGKTYRLTNNVNSGSKGTVKDANTLKIDLGTLDMAELTGLGGTDVQLIISAGSLLKDAAGNASQNPGQVITLPVKVTTKLDPPTNIVLTPIGANIVPNTINSSTIQLTTSANITPGQAVGGRAELYVGDRLIATDSLISLTDSTVTFTTFDAAPTYERLMALIPSGGEVKVKLYNANNDVVTSKPGPVLRVDYLAPTLSEISSVIYNRSTHQLYFTVTGAGAIGDKVDVNLITIHDPILGKSYHLTASKNGSEGYVNGENSLVVNIGVTDRYGLLGFESGNMFITIAPGSLIKDEAGNSSNNRTEQITLPVTIIK